MNMEEAERLLGPELYARVTEKLNGRGVIVDDGRLIPKHRFDCINVSLREHKEKAARLERENAEIAKQAAECERLRQALAAERRERAVTEALLRSRVKNARAVRALLDLPETGWEESLARQLKKLRRTDPYLFESGGGTYVLVPYDKMKRTEADG